MYPEQTERNNVGRKNHVFCDDFRNCLPVLFRYCHRGEEMRCVMGFLACVGVFRFAYVARMLVEVGAEI